MLAQSRQRLSAEVVVGVVFVSSLFMTIMDITVVNVAIPTIAREFHAPHLVGAVGGHGLSAEPGDVDTGVRLDGGSFRHQTGTPRLDCDLHCRLGLVRGGAKHDRTHCGPGVPRHRRRDDAAGRHGAPVPYLSSRAQGESIPDSDHPDGSGTRHRPDRRRFPRAARVMALGVSHQHSDRGARPDLRCALPPSPAVDTGRPFRPTRVPARRARPGGPALRGDSRAH